MAKVTVSFVTAEDDSKLLIESDPDRNKDYTGKTKTKFLYGDTAYFRVYSHEPENIAVVSTDGDVADMGIFIETVTGEVLSFITEQTAETDKPLKAIADYTWLGNSLGDVSIQDSYTLKAETAPTNENIAALSLSYKSVYRLFGLTLDRRNMTEYPVMVYVRSVDV